MKSRVPPWAIMTFCVWHTFAVATYNLPDNKGEWMAALHNLSAPYMLMTSQWQKWDIFSPDPQRRSAVYRLEVVDGTGAMIVKRMDSEHMGWAERAKEFKILSRMEADFGAVIPQYIALYCEEFPEAAGKDLRLVAEVMILPDTLTALRSMGKRSPSVTTDTLATVPCPPTS